MPNTTQAPERIWVHLNPDVDSLKRLGIVFEKSEANKYTAEYIRADLAQSAQSLDFKSLLQLIAKKVFLAGWHDAADYILSDFMQQQAMSTITVRSVTEIRDEALEEAAQVALLISQDGEYHGDASLDTASQIYQCGAIEVFDHIRALKSCAPKPAESDTQSMLERAYMAGFMDNGGVYNTMPPDTEESYLTSDYWLEKRDAALRALAGKDGA